MKRKCDRCNRNYKVEGMGHKGYTFPMIQGVSARCVERAWQVCPRCRDEVIAFMDYWQTVWGNKK